MREGASVVAAAGVVFLAVLACGDPGVSLSGNVVDSAGTPVVGATAKLTCPSRTETAVSDGAGHVTFGGIGTPSKYAGCTLTVEKPPLKPVSTTVAALCMRSSTDGNYAQPCAATEGRITMLP